MRNVNVFADFEYTDGQYSFILTMRNVNYDSNYICKWFGVGFILTMRNVNVSEYPTAF